MIRFPQRVHEPFGSGVGSPEIQSRDWTSLFYEHRVGGHPKGWGTIWILAPCRGGGENWAVGVGRLGRGS